MQQTKHKLESDLSNFNCTENYFLQPTFGYLYTDGVQYLAQECKAYWLLDAIWSYQKTKLFLKDEALKSIQFWKLKVDLEKCKGVLICERDEGDIVITQKLDYTDFPLKEIQIYVQNHTLLLPSEY